MQIENISPIAEMTAHNVLSTGQVVLKAAWVLRARNIAGYVRSEFAVWNRE